LATSVYGTPFPDAHLSETPEDQKKATAESTLRVHPFYDWPFII